MLIPVRIELFGGLRILVGKQEAPRFRSQKPPALLAYLAYCSDRAHPRELLIDMLWPDADPDAGRNRLNVTLSRIRAHLDASTAPSGLLLSDRLHVWLNRDLIDTDVSEFNASLASAA